MHIITRRFFTAGVAAIGATALMPRPARADLAAMQAAARQEGTLTWYIAQEDTETAERMGRAFSEKYPGIKVEVIRTTGQVAYERLLQDLKNNAPQCDVFSSTDIAQYPALKQRKALAEFTPQGAATLLPAFANLADPGLYSPASATSHLLVYHKQNVAQADAPKSWTDLLDPKWKGRVATGHPAFSGCTGIWGLAIRKTYGWGY